MYSVWSLLLSGNASTGPLTVWADAAVMMKMVRKKSVVQIVPGQPCVVTKIVGTRGLHTMGECSLFKEAETKLTLDKLKLLKLIVLQLTISVLRCIALRERDPLKWEKLMKMEVNFGAHSYWKQNPKHDHREAVVSLVNEWMEGAKTPITKDLIVKLCDVFYLLNAFAMPHATSYRPSVSFIMLYSIHSHL